MADLGSPPKHKGKRGSPSTPATNSRVTPDAKRTEMDKQAENHGQDDETEQDRGDEVVAKEEHYIKVIQPPPRTTLSRKELLLAYSNVASTNNMNLVPEYGIGAETPVGPYFIYASDEDAKALASVCSTLEVEHRDKEGDITKVMCSIKLLKHDEEERVDDREEGAARRSDLSTLHTIAYLDDPAAFRHVRASDYKKAWANAGFIAFGIHRQKITIADGVSAGETEKLHANVRPLVGGLIESLDKPGTWPQKISTHVKWKVNNAVAERVFELDYGITVEKGSNLPTTHCLRVHKHKRPCSCPPGKRAGAGRKRKADEALAEKALYELLGKAKKTPAGGEQFEAECPYYKVGKCVRVRTGAPQCLLGKHGPPEPHTIECMLTGVAGTCRNRARCMYKHTNGNGPAASSSGITDADLMDGVEDSLL